MNDAMEILINPETLASALPVIKGVFWALMAWFVLAVLRRMFGAGGRKAIGRSYRIFFAVIALLFAALLVYQATWQLAGFARPEFIEFMKRYNRRPDNPAARMVRGTIFSAEGERLAVHEPGLPGQRDYPGGPAFAQVIGYHHPVYGLAGIEGAEHAHLSGVTRASGPEWERFGKNMLQREALRGHDLTLTLRADLQREAHRLMEGKKGAVVLLDPSNGALLVVYSAPTYDPRDLEPALFDRKDAQARLLNRALQGLYPPGSTFKAMVAAAALEKGIDPVIDCPAEGYRAGTGNKPIRDHEYYTYQREGKTWPGYGRLTMREAMAKSSNVYFARLGVQVGGAALRAAVERWGFAGSWLVHEGSSGRMATAAGRFPQLTDRDLARTAQVSIGQGDMVVTPLHMALLAGAIGRRGVVWKPRLVAEVPPQPLDAVLDPATAKMLVGQLRHAVQTGTGRGADIAGLAVAGKTGTAQNPHGADHGWFFGFAPAGNPRIAFAVIVEQGGYGSQSAVPVVVGLLSKAQAVGYFDTPPAASAAPAGGVR
jgi:peptidoglycan glycosyltransferase